MADRPYCDTACAEEGTQNAVPSSDSIPASPCPQRFCQLELECRHAHSLWVAAAMRVGDGWGALVLSIGKARSIVVTQPIQLQSDFMRLGALLPPSTLTSSYHFLNSNKHAQTKPNSLGHRFSGTAFGWSSFVTFVSRRSLALRSALFCQSRLCSSARRIPQNRAVLASAPFGSAPLWRLTAPPCAPSSPFMKRMFFSGPPRPEF
jgi:hypothetical protein